MEEQHVLRFVLWSPECSTPDSVIVLGSQFQHRRAAPIPSSPWSPDSEITMESRFQHRRGALSSSLPWSLDSSSSWSPDSEVVRNIPFLVPTESQAASFLTLRLLGAVSDNNVRHRQRFSVAVDLMVKRQLPATARV